VQAVAAAHQKVTGYGAQAALPTRDQIEGMLQKLTASKQAVEDM
jgi:hypothetical protein